MWMWCEPRGPRCMAAPYPDHRNHQHQMKSLKIAACFIKHNISNSLKILITWISIFTLPYLDHDRQHCGSGDAGGSDAKVGIRSLVVASFSLLLHKNKHREWEEGEQSGRRKLRRGPLLTDRLIIPSSCSCSLFMPMFKHMLLLLLMLGREPLLITHL